MTSGNPLREFESIIRKYYFCFCAYSLATLNDMISTVSIYFQNHPGTKHLYGDFCPIFTGIPSVSSGIRPCRDGMKNIPASQKQNITFIKKWLYASHPVYCPVRFFILSRFSFKQPLTPPESYQSIQGEPEYYSILQFRIILKIVAVNMLLSRSLSNIYDETFWENTF